MIHLSTADRAEIEARRERVQQLEQILKGEPESVAVTHEIALEVSKLLGAALAQQERLLSALPHDRA